MTRSSMIDVTYFMSLHHMRRFILVSSLCFFCFACSPLSRPDKDLRSEYLAITQPGINMDTAVRLIKNKIHPEGELLVRQQYPLPGTRSTQPAKRQRIDQGRSGLVLLGRHSHPYLR